MPDQHPHPALSMARGIGVPGRWHWTVEHHGIVLALSEGYPTPATCALAMATDGVRTLADCEATLDQPGRR